MQTRNRKKDSASTYLRAKETNRKSKRRKENKKETDMKNK
jgi:hypothetical protein